MRFYLNSANRIVMPSSMRNKQNPFNLETILVSDPTAIPTKCYNFAADFYNAGYFSLMISPERCLSCVPCDSVTNIVIAFAYLSW